MSTTPPTSSPRAERNRKALPFQALVCAGALCFSLVGCSFMRGGEQVAPHTPQYSGSGFLPSAKVTSVSRVCLPAAGGQTIQPPKMMGDTYSLWSPLSKQERMRQKPMPGFADWQRADGARFGGSAGQWLPPSESEAMQQYLYRLVHSRPEVTRRSLARAEQYMPIVLEGVRSKGLPLELACLPLVESAFEPRAVSSAGAAGLWQLMPGTARRFGLRVDATTDERFDVAKATDAATSYLLLLYQQFGDWPTALAAYNCGEGTMVRAASGTGRNTLAGISDWRRANMDQPSPLPQETAQFVPAFAAAMIVMTEAQTFGLASRPLFALSGSAEAAPWQRQSPAPVSVQQPLPIQTERRTPEPLPEREAVNTRPVITANSTPPLSGQSVAPPPSSPMPPQSRRIP